MTAVHDAGHISWVDMERQQTSGINGDVQMLSWEGWLQKRLSYTISQLMSTEGFNNINSLRLTTSWGCKSNGASFHLHLHSCSSEGWGQGEVFWSNPFSSSMVFSFAGQTAAAAEVSCWCCILYACSFLCMGDKTPTV